MGIYWTSVTCPRNGYKVEITAPGHGEEARQVALAAMRAWDAVGLGNVVPVLSAMADGRVVHIGDADAAGRGVAVGVLLSEDWATLSESIDAARLALGFDSGGQHESIAALLADLVAAIKDDGDGRPFGEEGEPDPSSFGAAGPREEQIVRRAWRDGWDQGWDKGWEAGLSAARGLVASSERDKALAAKLDEECGAVGRLDIGDPEAVPGSGFLDLEAPVVEGFRAVPSVTLDIRIDIGGGGGADRIRLDGEG